MTTRREFLKASSLVALAPTIPGFLERAARAAEPGQDRRILVVVQLDGGNDGINTVVPFRDEGYAENRSELRLPTGRLHTLTDAVGLHPAMRAAAGLVEDGRLGIVQGVGYPNPNRSHDVSMSIWHTARFDQTEHDSYGWIGRALDTAASESGTTSSMMVGDEALPQALIGRRAAATSLSSLEDLAINNEAVARNTPSPPAEDKRPGSDLAAFVRRTTLDAYATADLLQKIGRKDAAAESYPGTELGNRLRLIARLIKAGLPTRVYYAVQPGYDTHAVQLPAHARLLREFSGALHAFLDDLRKAGLDDRIVVMAFSEFGRRVAENASRGTDHGTAGPMFLGGPSVKAGTIGETPSLQDLDDGDLKRSIDFRRVYAAVLEDWLRIPSQPALGDNVPPVELFG